MFSLILGIYIEVAEPNVRDIPRVRVPSFSLVLEGPFPTLGGTSLPFKVAWDSHRGLFGCP